MPNGMQSQGAILSYPHPTAEMFDREILPSARPALFPSLVADWPVVAAGSASPEMLVAYLKPFDRGGTVGAMLGPPPIRGRFFYNQDLTGFNFRRESVKLSAALDFLLAALAEDNPSSLAVQSVPVRQHLPAFEAENRLPLLGDAVEPRLWIGNSAVVAAHHDPSENIACVVAGRRRFTLFPPEQVANLYPGPFELTPAGPTISMVDFDAPDLERYPRFANALAAAITVDLEPGDALYIPYLWWHHVRATGPINVLVNYWWAPPAPGRGRPLDAFLHAMLAIKNLPEPHRDAWRALFDHYVFQDNGSPGDHLPPARRGVVGTIDPQAAGTLRAAIIRALNQAS
jgi:hypothetical protein